MNKQEIQSAIECAAMQHGITLTLAQYESVQSVITKGINFFVIIRKNKWMRDFKVIVPSKETQNIVRSLIKRACRVDCVLSVTANGVSAITPTGANKACNRFTVTTDTNVYDRCERVEKRVKTAFDECQTKGIRKHCKTYGNERAFLAAKSMNAL